MKNNGLIKQLIKGVWVQFGSGTSCPVCNKDLTIGQNGKWCFVCEYGIPEDLRRRK